jgi:hypothetical protein
LDLSEPECKPLHSAKLNHIAEPSSQSTGQASQSLRMSGSSKPQTSQSQSMLFAEDTHASPSVSPGSDWARQMTVTSGRSISALSKNSGPLGCVEKMLLDTSAWASTQCYLTWKHSATPAGRLLFRLVPSVPSTVETDAGLLPTPAASDCKGAVQGPSLETRREMSRGVRLEEFLLRMLPTPSAGNSHSAGRLDEWGGKNPFRGTDLGKLHLNPSFVEELMGFPIGHTALDHWETPSSRKSRK